MKCSTIYKVTLILIAYFFIFKIETKFYATKRTIFLLSTEKGTVLSVKEY